MLVVLSVTPVVLGCGCGNTSSESETDAYDASVHEPPVCVGAEGEIPGVNCYPPQPDGGIYGRCIEEGESFEARVIGAGCCEGLTAVDSAVPADTEAVDSGAAFLMDAGLACTEPGPPSIKVCTRCGNGECGIAENVCNCWDDCG